MAKAPPITRETAREYSAKGNAIRWSRWRAARDAARLASVPKVPTSATPEDYRREVTLAQLDRLDLLIDDALTKHDSDKFLQLAAAKERLWKLVQPTAGSLRPGRARRESAPMLSEPQPIAPAQVSPIAPTSTPVQPTQPGQNVTPV